MRQSSKPKTKITGQGRAFYVLSKLAKLLVVLLAVTAGLATTLSFLLNINISNTINYVVVMLI